MTQDQIKYQQLMEERRHNLQMEGFTGQELEAKVANMQADTALKKAQKGETRTRSGKNVANTFESTGHFVNEFIDSVGDVIHLGSSVARLIG